MAAEYGSNPEAREETGEGSVLHNEMENIDEHVREKYTKDLRRTVGEKNVFTVDMIKKLRNACEDILLPSDTEEDAKTSDYMSRLTERAQFIVDILERSIVELDHRDETCNKVIEALEKKIAQALRATRLPETPQSPSTEVSHHHTLMWEEKANFMIRDIDKLGSYLFEEHLEDKEKSILISRVEALQSHVNKILQTMGTNEADVDSLLRTISDLKTVNKFVSEENTFLKDAFAKLTKDVPKSESLHLKDLLNQLMVKDKKYVMLVERVELLERVIDDDCLHTINYQKESLHTEQNKNRELMDVLEIIINAGTSMSNERMIKKFSESIQEKNKEIEDLKSEIQIYKQPTKFTKLIRSLQKNYLAQRLKNISLENELNALKREWSMVFKKQAFVHPDPLYIEQEHISILRAHIEQLEGNLEKVSQECRENSRNCSSKIQSLEKDLADERIGYTILLSNYKNLGKESNKLVEDMTTSVQRMSEERDLINSNNGTTDTFDETEKSKEDETDGLDEVFTHEDSKSDLKKHIEDILPILEELYEYTTKLCLATESSKLIHALPRESNIIKNIIRLQKYQLEMLLDLLQVQMGQETDEQQLIKWDELDSSLREVARKLSERDELQKLHFATELIEEFRLLCGRLTAMDTKVQDVLENTSELNALIDETLPLDQNSYLVAEYSSQLQKRRIDQIKDKLLYLYLKFTQLSQYGVGQSEIMSRFKLEMQAMHSIFSKITSMDNHPSYLFKTNLAFRRIEENIKKVMKEIEFIHLFEGSLYTSKEIVDNRKLLESQVREMELLARLEYNKLIGLKDAIEKTELQISLTRKAVSEGRAISRDLYTSLTATELKRVRLKNDLDEGRFQLRSLWFDMGKQSFLKKIHSEEPVTIEALQIHLDKALEDEMRTRLDLENEKAVRRELEEQMMSIYLDMERTAMKGRKILQSMHGSLSNLPCPCTFFTKLAETYN